eukprot:GEMP01018968.1.p1 GENE.GEMP01018968.1~~GEMP01018968.1.p1  ORF type:complete len:615 (+),score=121.72 GEMP01018968.1:77-1921(+)
MGRPKPPKPAVPFVFGELCDYDVIFDVVKSKGWAIRKGPRDVTGKSVRVTDPDMFEIPPHSTLIWVDQAVMVPAIMSKVLPWQMVNHFPGMSTMLARKGRLCRNLTRLQRLCPKEFTFLPQTFVLPEDHEVLRKAMATSKRKTFIYKPDHQCQGRGIQLMQQWEDVEQSGALRNRESVVVQRYISNPLLLDGFKFDLRLYLLVTSLDPIQIYVFKDGLVRLSTQAYEPPSSDNLQQRCMHLTNYAVNKKSEHYEVGEEDGTGSKRHLSWFMDFVEEHYGAKARNVLWKRMKLLCVKMLLSVQPQLLLEYDGGLPKDLAKTKRSRCFEILGVDVLIDDKLKPWLLEVNHLPSFGTDSALDLDIKSRLVSQTLDLIQVLPRAGRKMYEQLIKLDGDENRKLYDEAWRREDNLDDFERAYPTDVEDVQARYDEVLRLSQELCQSTYRRLFGNPASGRLARPLSHHNKTTEAPDTQETTASNASIADSSSSSATPVPPKKQIMTTPKEARILGYPPSPPPIPTPEPPHDAPPQPKIRKRLVPRCAMAVLGKVRMRADMRRNSADMANRRAPLPMKQVALSFGRQQNVFTVARPSENDDSNRIVPRTNSRDTRWCAIAV